MKGMASMNLKFSAKKIVNYKFTGVEKGYEPLEVDLFLDSVAEDYMQIDNLVYALEKAQNDSQNKQVIIDELHEKITQLKKQIDDLKYANMRVEAELDFQKTRIDGAVKSKREFSSSIDYINYIRVLEKALVEHGGNPDDCRKNMYKYK